MTVIYRISSGGYSKVKPDFATKMACLRNAKKQFPGKDVAWFIIADNLSEDLEVDLHLNMPHNAIVIPCNIGHGAGTYNKALDLVQAHLTDRSEVVYMLEDDYLHAGESMRAINEALEMGAEYVTLYDHPDKYLDGVNPHVEGGGETTKVFLTKSCHWKFTNSTTMTFACTVETLLKDMDVHREYTEGTHPRDYDMWRMLSERHRRSLVSPIPGYSTHCEVAWLSPLTDWEAQC